jgi:hypothetical protein
MGRLSLRRHGVCLGRLVETEGLGLLNHFLEGVPDILGPETGGDFRLGNGLPSTLDPSQNPPRDGGRGGLRDCSRC